jgi:two-component system sensor histidine kinase ChvG
MDRLISDISSASRLDSELLRDEMGTIDLNMLLLKLADAHARPLGHGSGESTIRLDLPPLGQADVRGNEGRLAQVFENLITNALSFSPPGGRVMLSVTPEKNQVRVAVEDQGPGIPENKLENIFERFYTERPPHEDYGGHSGLGLSIARQIVNAHGGSIRAENVKDETGQVTGARFTVMLDKAAV